MFFQTAKRVMGRLSTTTEEKTALELLVLFALIFAHPSNLYADAQILGFWTEGTTHTAESGTNRALIFTAHTEDQDSDMNITSVTYGGQSMTKVIEQNHGTLFRSYVAAFILDEVGINDANSNTFGVTWAQNPLTTPGYSSVFLGNIIQSTPIGASEGNGASSGYTITTNPLSTNNGDIVIVAGTNGNSGTYSVNNGFTKAIEPTVQSGDGVAGYKQATGVNETPSITHSSNTRQVIIGFVVRSGEADPPTPNPASFSSAPAAVSDTEITMTATVGTDATGPVEYYFDEISGNPGGTDSGWVTNRVYNDADLDPSTQYTYTVQMRDAFFNTGDVSTPPQSATTERAPDLIVAISGGDYTNIQAAINACSRGWIVEVDDGFWGGGGKSRYRLRRQVHNRSQRKRTRKLHYKLRGNSNDTIPRVLLSKRRRCQFNCGRLYYQKWLCRYSWWSHFMRGFRRRGTIFPNNQELHNHRESSGC
ncbi:MAG: hypothetical protein GY869_12020 [Planctomycetes bacterium]|nr:hypothetical protein [Planctomycetota bacterium]